MRTIRAVLTHECFHDGFFLTPQAPLPTFVLSVGHSLDFHDGDNFLADSSSYVAVFGLVGVLDMPLTNVLEVLRLLSLEFETLCEEPVKGVVLRLLSLEFEMLCEEPVKGELPPLRGIHREI